MTSATPGNDDKVLDKIRLLMNQAAEDSGATDAEREAFAAKAAAMMAKYCVDAAMLAAAHGRRDDDVIESRLIVTGNPYAKPKAILLNEIASACGVRLIRAVDRKSCHLVGYRSDLDRVEMVYTSLLVQAITMVGRTRTYGNASQVRSFRGNWLLGFASRIGERMTEATRQATAEAAPVAGRGAELVLADRATLVRREAESLFSGTRKQKAQVTSANGYYAGAAAGDRADLGQTRVGARRTAIGA